MTINFVKLAVETLLNKTVQIGETLDDINEGLELIDFRTTRERTSSTGKMITIPSAGNLQQVPITGKAKPQPHLKKGKSPGNEVENI